MTAPQQIEFDWLLAHCSPLLTPGEAAHVLDCTERHCADLLDGDHLRAINIALNPEGELRTLRYFRWSVIHHAMKPELPLGQVEITALLTHSRPWWLLGEAARFLRCSGEHVRNLHAAKILDGPDRASLRDAQHSNCRITRESFLHFLNSRQIQTT